MVSFRASCRGGDTNVLRDGWILKALQLFLFGRFRVCCCDHELAGFDGRKVQELLCYLLVHRARPHARDYLASLLWNGESDTRARGYLRKALWQLHAALTNAELAVENHMLEANGESIKLMSTEHFWLDIDIFEQSYNAVKSISGKDLDAEQAHDLENAETLYQGEVLEGWDQDWCLCERARFHHMYLSIMDKLLDYCETCQSYERGIDYGMRILHFDRIHERTYQKLMRLHYLAGDRTSALREYEHCTEVLIDELGVQPSQQTKALYQQIQGGIIGERPLSQAKPYEAVLDIDLARMLERLQEVQSSIGDLQGRVQREIAALENALTGHHH